MKIVLTCLAVLWGGIGSSASFGADSTLDEARRAAALLGPESVPQILEIKNAGRNGKYPSAFYALVFELEKILWFYCSIDGTQSLSLARGNPTRDRTELGKLLRAVDAGFQALKIVDGDHVGNPPPGVVPARESSPLRNGCFIESVHAFRQASATGTSGRNFRLLLYYSSGFHRPGGHTVLVYDAVDGLKIVDPARGNGVETFSSLIGSAGERVATAYAGFPVASARWLALENPRLSQVARSKSPGPSAAANG